MRNCNCSGNCGSNEHGLSRRDFLELIGVGTAATFLAPSAWGAFELPADELERWKRDLFAPTSPRRYRSSQHTDARMHLGGIGTGNFEIGADGRLTTWQLFNTLRDGDVPFHFGVCAGQVARLLQTAGGPEWPRIRQIEMQGEYPFATLRFVDPDLPVQLELTAFSPFAPLDTALSSVPLAAFVFRLTNPTAQAQTVSLAAFLQNPVGYDARGRNDALLGRHPNFGENLNEPLEAGPARGLCLRALPGKDPVLNTPVRILAGSTLKALTAPPTDTPASLSVRIADPLPAATELGDVPMRQTLVWLEETPADLSETYLRSARSLVQDGATLVFSGRTLPLLRAYAAASGGKPLGQASMRPDILFEDFERGYENWTVEGTAFGKEPAHGTLPNQQRVSGFVGRGLVNTFLEGDDTVGKLTSKPFTIDRHFIRFLVGGGRHGSTQIRLFVPDVSGQPVRRLSGNDNERLEPATWDVREFAGKTAHLEIVDHQKGPWGHINVDQIAFSDQPGNQAVMALLEELLPARFSGIRERAAEPGGAPGVLFDGLELQRDAQRAAAGNGLEYFTRPVGKGKVILAAGPILDPAHAEFSRARQSAYAVLCHFVGASYAAPQGQPPKAPGFGTLALAALTGERTVLPAFEDWAQAWQQFSGSGGFVEFADAKPGAPTAAGRTVHGAVASSITLAPGASAEVPFLLTWHYPNKYNAGGTWMGCHYTTLWADARAVMSDAATQFERWRAKTELFRSSFYASTLPYWLLDCVTANAAIARHIGVVFRLANGDPFGWEGSNGCCQPTCTHVWGYEQTLARLFPDLERAMRRIDFKHQQRPDGGVNNRTEVPSPARPTGEHPFADGHASCILKAYREALNAPDDAFLKEYWPHLQRAVQYLIDRDAKSHGGEPAGYLQDDQWNTYDEALHGVTTFISGYYLAALRAGEEWAKRMGDRATADRYHAVFLKGQRNLVELCWNGEYFQQHLPGYEKMPGEVGPGCMSDQLIGQWWAHQLGLGYLLPEDKVRAALKSVFKYNFKSDLTGWRHIPRAFAGAKDKGLIICTWPKGGRPGHVMLYSDEVWTGIEYQVAAHMIGEGMVEEGYAIVKAARDRYDGAPREPIGRNPWNEIECGGHYARAMSSWSLLTALSGWNYDGLTRLLAFGPQTTPERFQCAFVGPESWGSASQTAGGGKQRTEFAIKVGKLPVKELDLALAGSGKPNQVRVAVGNRQVPARLEVARQRAQIRLENEVTVGEGEALVVSLE